MPLVFDESIPIEKSKFIVILRDSLPPEKRKKFEQFAKLLEHCCHHKYQNILNDLYNSYKPFNPNIDFPDFLDEWEERSNLKNLIESFRRFLEQAQYQRISEYDILDILHLPLRNKFQISFPLERYQEFLVYFHQETYNKQKYRKWSSLWLRKHWRKIPHYKSLIVLFRPFRAVAKKPGKRFKHNKTLSENGTNSPQPITIKLFQNLPYDYLPIIFPGVLFKAPFIKKIYKVALIILTLASAIIGGTVFSPWHALIAIIPSLLLFYQITIEHKEEEKYYQDFLSNFYYNSVNNNQGVLRQLVEQSEENIYKKILAIFHAIWRRDLWSFSEISAYSLDPYLRKFFLEHYGVQVKLDIENILWECSCHHNGEKIMPKLLENKSPHRSYLKEDSSKGECFLDLKAENLTPYSGILDIAPGTERAEKAMFLRDNFILHFSQELKFSHPEGSAIRWLIENPYQSSLAEDCVKGSDYFLVDNPEELPLQGIGKLFVNNKNFEFRYYRERNSNRLYLTAGLRYRHIISKECPIWIRPTLPNFSLPKPLNKGSKEVLVPKNICFPTKGFVRFAESTDKDFIVRYTALETEKGQKLSFAEPTPFDYESVVSVACTPPVSSLKTRIKKGSSLIPIKETKHFGKWGTVILSPGEDHEERLPFYREALLLKLSTPLENSHRKGSIIEVGKTAKTKIINKARRGSDTILVHGFAGEIFQNTITISPDRDQKEIRKFTILEKYLYLGSPTKRHHAEKSEVWEANFESPLRYEALQGSSLITVENASSFPLRGNLEINFKATNGVKEVFPFQRTECSNTLLLTTQIDQVIPEKTRFFITAVEITAETPLHYHDQSIKADFSCVENFPCRGTILIEPGGRNAETIEFKRYLNRLYLKNHLKHKHAAGTAIDFSSYSQYTISEEISANSDRIYLECGYLLPTRGNLILKQGEQTEVVWYRKIPHRVFLEKPCLYPHNRGGSILFSGIEENVSLAAPIEKGSQEIQIFNGQELPYRGSLFIQGIFRSVKVKYIRKDSTLFLQSPIPYHFSMRAKIKYPKAYLRAHASPGMDYIEISKPSLLPKSGEIILEKAHYSKMYRKRNRKEERLICQYRPNTLWLDNPIKQTYPAGTQVVCPELLLNGASEIKAASLEEAVKKLDLFLGQKLSIG